MEMTEPPSAGRFTGSCLGAVATMGEIDPTGGLGGSLAAAGSGAAAATGAEG